MQPNGLAAKGTLWRALCSFTEREIGKVMQKNGLLGTNRAVECLEKDPLSVS